MRLVSLWLDNEWSSAEVCCIHFSKSQLPTATVIQKTCTIPSHDYLQQQSFKSLLQSLLQVTITYSNSHSQVLQSPLQVMITYSNSHSKDAVTFQVMINYSNNQSKVCCSHFSMSRLPTAAVNLQLYLLTYINSHSKVLQSLLQVMVIYINSHSKVCCSHFSKSWLSIAIIKSLLQSFLQHTITYRNSHWSKGCSKIKPLKPDCSCANGGRHAHPFMYTEKQLHVQISPPLAEPVISRWGSFAFFPKRWPCTSYKTGRKESMTIFHCIMAVLLPIPPVL